MPTMADMGAASVTSRKRHHDQPAVAHEGIPRVHLTTLLLLGCSLPVVGRAWVDSEKRGHSTSPWDACGLRHLAFTVDDLEASVEYLQAKGFILEAIRVDEFTGKRFVFFSDPDGLRWAVPKSNSLSCGEGSFFPSLFQIRMITFAIMVLL